MSKTDSTFIDKDSNLRVKTMNIKGQRISAPNKLSAQTIVKTPDGKKELAIKTDQNVNMEDIPGLLDTIDRLDKTDSGLQDQITDNADAIAQEEQTRAAAVESLYGNINTEAAARKDADNGLQEAIDGVAADVSAETSRAVSAESALDAAMVKKAILSTAQIDTEVISQPSLVAIKAVLAATDNGITQEKQMVLPVASGEQHGVMSKEAYSQLEETTSRVAALEGAAKRYPVHLGKEPLTQSEYQAAFEVAARVPMGTTPPDGATLVNLDDNHAITYFENASNGDHWIDRGIDTVSVATNIIAGIVKGSDGVAGKIFVELDGTMSVYGWDAFVALVNNHIADAVRHITNEERIAWNAKVDGNQGDENAGKVLKVGENGILAPAEITEGGARLPMFKREVSNFKFNDVSYLNANTFSWQDGSMYIAGYQHLVDDLATAGEVQSQTIEDITISFKVATDGHRICLADQEANVSALYAKTGQADFYILDTENARFKLPRTQIRRLIRAWKREDGKSWYNLYSDGWVEQGYLCPPNMNLEGGTTYPFAFPMQLGYTYEITPFINNARWVNNGIPAGIYARVLGTDKMEAKLINQTEGTGGVNCDEMSFYVCGYADASAIANEPVQYEYYYVGNFEQSSLAQTAGINAELFNAKADISFVEDEISNLKADVAHLAMPSNLNIDLDTSGLANGTQFTAPANGYISIGQTSTAAGQWINLEDTTSRVCSRIAAPSSGIELKAFIPARKNNNIYMKSTLGGTINFLKFIYANGEI